MKARKVPPSAPPAAKRQLLRHFLATLAYRSAKAIKDVPPGFADFQAGWGVRTPLGVLAHMADLLQWTLKQVFGIDGDTLKSTSDWNGQIERLHAMISGLDEALASEAVLLKYSDEQLLQGPLADAMTHVGQLAMLRRLARSPIPAENFAAAEIRVPGAARTKLVP